MPTRHTIKAAFKNGVLTITMEKREASTPKQALDPDQRLTRGSVFLKTTKR